MAHKNDQRFFVVRLDEKSYRPVPEAEFAIQVLDENSQAEKIAYVGRNQKDVLALVHSINGRLPLENHGIPIAVIEVAQRRPVGFGEYVSGSGEIVRPAFLSTLIKRRSGPEKA